MVGASFFRGPETETDFAEVLRTTGFAFTPACCACRGFLPPTLGLAIDLAWRWLWVVVVAAVVAIRQALDFTTACARSAPSAARPLLLWLIALGAGSVAPLPF